MADVFYGSGIPLASGFDYGGKKPLDSRTVANTIKERNAHVDNGRAYVGMLVYVIEDDCTYQYNGTEWVNFGIADYNDLENKPNIPTKISELENDNNYATNEQVSNAIANSVTDGTLDLSEYATTEKVEQAIDTAIADLVDSSPDTLDTLQKIADALGNDENFAATVTEEIGKKVDKEEGKSLISETELEKLANLENYDDTELRELISEKSDSVFVAEMETVTSLGGIPAGTDLNGLTMQEVLTKLLYPYIAPTISGSFTQSPSGTLFEKGVVVSVSAMRAVATKKSEPLTSIGFYRNNILIEQITEGVSNGGTFNVSFDTPFTVSSNINNTYFRVGVTDSTNKTVYGNTTAISFVYPYYMGVINVGTEITQDVVTNLTKKIENKGTKSHTFTTDNQCMVFAYPKSYGQLKKITDPNNFDVTSTFVQVELPIDCLDTTTQSYYVYVNNASTVSNFKITFNY